MLVLQPGFIAQLNWPNHSLAALSVLFLLALLFRSKDSLIACATGTILTTAILQSFSFAAILMAIPAMSDVKKLSRRDIMRRLGLIWTVWAASVIGALVLSRLLQMLVFGEVPQIDEWRNPDPVTSLADLAANLTQNLALWGSHVVLVYGVATVLLVILVGLILRGIVTQHCSAFAVMVLWTLATGVLLSWSLYVATAPFGVVISLRTTLNFGFAMSVIGALGWVVANSETARSRAFVMKSLIIALAIIPGITSYQNTAWFSAHTRNISAAVQDIAPLDIAERVFFHRPDPDVALVIEYPALFDTAPMFMESLDATTRLVPALREIGYTRFDSCNAVARDDACDIDTSGWALTCAKTNALVCSAGVVDEAWHVFLGLSPDR